MGGSIGPRDPWACGSAGCSADLAPSSYLHAGTGFLWTHLAPKLFRRRSWLSSYLHNFRSQSWYCPTPSAPRCLSTVRPVEPQPMQGPLDCMKEPRRQIVVAFKRNRAYTIEVLAQTYMRAINLKPRRCGDFSTNDPSKGRSRAEAMDTQSDAGHQLR